MKLGFRPDEIKAMPETEVEGYITAYDEIVNPEKKRTYLVRKAADKKRKR